MKDPDFVNSFAKSLTNSQNIWKAWTIFPFPEFHFRNMVGNHWNMFLAGMHVDDMVKYNTLATWVNSSNLDGGIRKRLINTVGGLQKALPKRMRLVPEDGTVRLGGTVYNQQELLDTMNDLGILRSGFYGSGELPVSLRKTVKKAEQSKLRSLVDITVEGNPFLRKGIKAAGAIEDTQRAALFMWGLDQGLDASKSKDAVFKFLFDYSDLTDFEQKVFRNFLFPFYAWSRKNIPLQMEYLVKEPTKFSALQKIKENLESQIRAGDAPDERFLSEFVREGFNVRLRRRPDNDLEYFVADNWIPAADLASIDSPKELLKRFPLEQLGPLIKIPARNIFQWLPTILRK